jgi:DNA-binding NtrC family response regulator
MRATILIVDDEPNILRLLEQMLEGHDHEVHVAGGGSAGLQRFRELNAGVDLVISDVVMPGITGPEMVREMLAIRPALQVLFVTGFGPPDYPAEGEPDRRFPILSKPFGRGEFLQQVYSALARAGEPLKRRPARAESAANGAGERRKGVRVGEEF